jgi:hypothetical protein
MCGRHPCADRDGVKIEKADSMLARSLSGGTPKLNRFAKIQRIAPPRLA